MIIGTGLNPGDRMRFTGWLLLLLLFLMCPRSTLAEGQNVSGRVVDPQGNAVANALVSLVAEDGRQSQQTTTGRDGQFIFTAILPGKYALKLNVAGFEFVDQPLVVPETEPVTRDIRLKLAAAEQEVRVSTDVLDVNVLRPRDGHD